MASSYSNIFLLFALVQCVLPIVLALQFTDAAVTPQPVANYVRYVTFLANGTRTYVCSPGSSSNNYTLTEFDYALTDAEENTSLFLGKHVLMAKKDAEGGNSIFYTQNALFTYWVDKTTKFAPNPNPNPLDLLLEQELRTEASEPKPLEAGKYDMGIAVYATRFGAVGGNVPPTAICTPKTKTLVLKSAASYSMWKQIA